MPPVQDRFSTRNVTIAFRVSVAVFVALVVAIHVVRIVEPLGVDQGLFACFTRWVPRGWLPYRDIFDSKPPLFLYWYALAAAIPGDVVRAIWWVEGAWLAATLAFAYALGARLWGRWAGLATSVLLFVGLWSPAWGGFWSRAQAEELLALPMLASAWYALSARERVRLAFFAGVLAGVCGLFKIPSMAIAGAWAITWLAGMPWRDAAKRVGLLAAGIALPWALAFAWFAAHHALPAFVEGVFVYHRYNAAFIAPPWSDVVVRFAKGIADGASLPLVAAIIGVVRLARSKAREAVFLASWSVLTMAAIVLQRQLADYHYLLAMPALALGGAYAIVDCARTVRDGERKVTSAVFLVLLTVIGARSGAEWRRAYAPDAARLTGKMTRVDYLHRTQMGSYSTATEEAAAQYVRDRTAPTDGVLVWGLSPGLYALADRHPVTRFPFHKILMTDAPLSRMWPGLDDRRARFMERVRSDPPVYILVGRGDANGFEPQDSLASLRRFAELFELVSREYHVDTEIGRFLVFRRGAPVY
jgi:4-amino-4-deoxy-L-arabinose transferase-like glycosyltransferase